MDDKRKGGGGGTKQIGVYILACADGSLYPGWTTDAKARLDAHNSGRGSKYTRSRLPVKLAYWQPMESKSAALRREQEIKRMSHAEKQRLAEGCGNICVGANGVRPHLTET